MKKAVIFLFMIILVPFLGASQDKRSSVTIDPFSKEARELEKKKFKKKEKLKEEYSKKKNNNKKEKKKPAIVIDNAWVRATIGNVMLSSLYFDITNNTKETEYLLSTHVSIAEYADIHKTVLDKYISRIVHIDKVAIPPETTVKFKPGGLYVMLLRIKKPLDVGEKLSFSLNFQNKGQVTSKAIVRN